MSSVILHISGPPASGKTVFAKLIASRMRQVKPQFIRFNIRDNGRSPQLKIAQPLDEMADATRRTVRSAFVFEDVSEVIQDAIRETPGAAILVETDADPCFRHAYPYDAKVFVMAPPDNLDAVFRSSAEAANAIDRAMDDTTEFAAELFGLDKDFHDSAVLPAIELQDRRTVAGVAQTPEEFLQTDVGAEIASRMLLQPQYHAIIDSDVVLLNMSLVRDTAVAAECAERIDALLEPLRRRLARRHWLAACDPADLDSPIARRCVDEVESLLRNAGMGL